MILLHFVHFVALLLFWKYPLFWFYHAQATRILPRIKFRTKTVILTNSTYSSHFLNTPIQKQNYTTTKTTKRYIQHKRNFGHTTNTSREICKLHHSKIQKNWVYCDVSLGSISVNFIHSKFIDLLALISNHIFITSTHITNN